MMAPTDRYTPPLIVFMLLLIERTSFRNCLFSGLVSEDLSIALISSNLADKALIFITLAVSVEVRTAGLFSEEALEGVMKAPDSNKAVTMDTVSFFIITKSKSWINFHRQRSSLLFG